jgi:hypothetical protein
MKIAVLLLSFAAVSTQAFEIKKCDELKSEIAAKLDAKGVKSYQLDIVATTDVKNQTVIGSCEGGTKKITYTKDGAADSSAAKADPKVKSGAK